MVRRRESGAIEVERDGQLVQPVRPLLREIAAKLKVTSKNGMGNDLNTRQLGAKVIETIQELDLNA